MRFWGTVLALLTLSPPLLGADLRGHIEFLGATFPSQDLSEVRARLFTRYDSWLGHNWHLRAAAYAYGGVGGESRNASAIVRPHEVYLERQGDRFEFRLGFSNVAWGVLDEIQPTDRINPLDVARFVLEGRAEARLPVPLARARMFLPGELTLEAIWVPLPRQGTFDQLDEASSPFNPVARQQPIDLPYSHLPRTARNMEFGARIQASTAGVDWAASVYRDVVDFDRFQVRDSDLPSSSGLIPESPIIEAIRPPRWMLGGELETVAGAWTIRGEAALDLRDPLQALFPFRIIESWSFQGGLGMDRRYGDTTLFLNGVYRSVPEQPDLQDEDAFTLVGGLHQTFSRGTRSVRLFGVWSPRQDSGFLRAMLGAEIVENLRAEISGGLFLGEGQNIFGLLDASDFLLARLRIYFW